MATKATKKEVTPVFAGESVISVPTTEVYRRPGFNPRKNVEASTDVDDTWADFKLSIALGQDQPAIVMPYVGKLKYKYELVCGDRRMTALEQNAAPHGYTPQIKVIVRDLSPIDALFLAGGDNTARNPLSASEVSSLIERIREQLAAEHVSMSDGQIGQRLGKGQTYISKLSKIEKTVAPEVVEAWRAGTAVASEGDANGVKAAVKTVGYQAIAKLAGSGKVPKTAEEQIKAYNDLVAAPSTTQATGTRGMIERKKADARVAGTLFGRLVKLAAIEALDYAWFVTHLHLLMTIPSQAGRGKAPLTATTVFDPNAGEKEAEVRQDGKTGKGSFLVLKSFDDAAYKAYKEALTAPEPEEKAEKTVETPAPKKK